MAKGGGSAPGDRSAGALTVLATARRSIDGTGKAAERRLARLDRLEKKIKRGLKDEAKRQRQLDEARAGLADLVMRVTALVESSRGAAAPEAHASAPAPERPRTSGSTAALARRTRTGGGSRGPSRS